MQRNGLLRGSTPCGVGNPGIVTPGGEPRSDSSDRSIRCVSVMSPATRRHTSHFPNRGSPQRTRPPRLIRAGSLVSLKCQAFNLVIEGSNPSRPLERLRLTAALAHLRMRRTAGSCVTTRRYDLPFATGRATSVKEQPYDGCSKRFKSASRGIPGSTPRPDSSRPRTVQSPMGSARGRATSLDKREVPGSNPGSDTIPVTIAQSGRALIPLVLTHGLVAQVEEQVTPNHQVGGSKPSESTCPSHDGRATG